MTKRLYLDEALLAQIGFDQAMIATFRKLSEYASAIDRLGGVEEAAEEATLSLDSLDTRLDTAETDIDALEAASANYVQKDQEAAPSISVYAGQTVSAGYVQAEAQATDDAVAALSATVDDLISKLQSAEVLS